MKLLSFAASNSANSINRALVQFAAARVAQQMTNIEVQGLDLADYRPPIYSPEIEAAEGVPQATLDLFAAIGAADAVLVSFAEHNGYASAAWKNLFDWMSRHDRHVWQQKPLVMLRLPWQAGGRQCSGRDDGYGPAIWRGCFGPARLWPLGTDMGWADLQRSGCFKRP